MATSTGFVQQLSLLSGPTACVWVGDTPGSAELLTLAVGSGDTAETIATKQSLTATLVEATAGGRRVSVEHPDDSAAVSSVRFPRDDVIPRPLQLDGLEVTQAVQDVSQSVPLLAGKKTVVRVYLSYFANPGITVTGQISLRKAPTDPPVVVASTAAVVLDPADAGDLAATRNDVSRSLNFVVPATIASEGPLTITLSRVTDTVTGALVPVGGERRPTVWFHRNAPLRVRIFACVTPRVPRRSRTCPLISTSNCCCHGWRGRTPPARYTAPVSSSPPAQHPRSPAATSTPRSRRCGSWTSRQGRTSARTITPWSAMGGSSCAGARGFR